MAKRSLDVELSLDGIKKAIDFLKDYNDWVADKTRELVTRLSSIGRKIAEANNVGDENNEAGVLTTKVDQVGMFNTIATIFYKGEKVAFIEFGAGVHYNTPVGTSPHKYGEQFGYTIGSFGHGLGRFDSWTKPDGNPTNGTRARMPMLKASEYIRWNLTQIAEDVFN